MWSEQLVLPGPGNVAGCMHLTWARQCYFHLVFSPEPCLETIAWNLYAWLGLSAMKGCGMPSRFCLSALRNLTQSSEEADQEFWEPFEPHLSFGRVPVGWRERHVCHLHNMCGLCRCQHTNDLAHTASSLVSTAPKGKCFLLTVFPAMHRGRLQFLQEAAVWMFGSFSCWCSRQVLWFLLKESRVTLNSMAWKGQSSV